MISASENDRQLVVTILTSSFRDNPSILYLIPKDQHFEQRLQELVEYAFDVCILYGEVWLSDDLKACALILLPHLKKTTLYSLWLDLKLAIATIGLAMTYFALRREAKIKALHPGIPMAYLWFIGVDPDFQANGNGSRLLKEIIDHSGSTGLPIYLETSVPRNVTWYSRFGFQQYACLELSYKLYFLKYEPVI